MRTSPQLLRRPRTARFWLSVLEGERIIGHVAMPLNSAWRVQPQTLRVRPCVVATSEESHGSVLVLIERVVAKPIAIDHATRPFSASVPQLRLPMKSQSGRPYLSPSGFGQTIRCTVRSGS